MVRFINHRAPLISNMGTHPSLYLDVLSLPPSHSLCMYLCILHALVGMTNYLFSVPGIQSILSEKLCHDDPVESFLSAAGQTILLFSNSV